MQIPIAQRRRSDHTFVCDFCQDKFTKEVDLEKHQVAVHGTLSNESQGGWFFAISLYCGLEYFSFSSSVIIQIKISNLVILISIRAS